MFFFLLMVCHIKYTLALKWSEQPTYFNVKGRFRKQITQHPTQWLEQSFKTTMKQFCGLGKEEPLSSWSNSKHPLTIIHCVVSDFWKSEVLKNNRIWKTSCSFSFLLSVATNSTVGQKYSDKRRVIFFFFFFFSKIWSRILLSQLAPFCLTQTTLVVKVLSYQQKQWH